MVVDGNFFEELPVCGGEKVGFDDIEDVFDAIAT